MLQKNNVITEQLLCLQADGIYFEETDNRIVAHLRDTILYSNRASVMVKTADSDVLVILITFMPQLQEYCRHTKIWVDFGTANSKRMIFVNDCCNHLDELISLGLTFFHSLFGCDSTASFYRKSKNIL